MIRQHISLIFVILAFLLCNEARADTIILKSGREIYCNVIKETDDSVEIDMYGKLVTFYKDEIESIIKVTDEEKERFRSEELEYAESQREKGLVLYGGKWMKPGQRNANLWKDSLKIANVSAEWVPSPRDITKKKWITRLAMVVENISGDFDLESVHFKVVVFDADENIRGEPVVKYAGAITSGYTMPVMIHAGEELESDAAFITMDLQPQRKWTAEVYAGYSKDGPWEEVKAIKVEIPLKYIGGGY